MSELVEVDVLVAGGGVGGLMAAYRAQRAGARVLLLGGSGGASSRISSLNTALGYAEADSPAGLFDDMIKAGGYVNDPSLLAAVTQRIGAEIRHLADLGVPFIRDGSRLARRQATGSSWPRAVYTEGMVGVAVSRQLLAELEAGSNPDPILVKGGLLTDLNTVDGQVVGGTALSTRTNSYLTVRCGAVVLATGGAGHLFGTTTNPRGSQGTGYAMALEAGAVLSDMEFVSFEPFVTAGPAETRGHNLPTTVLLNGARLINGLGEEFIDTSRGPTKDVICRAMVREVLKGRGTPTGAVQFDLRDVPDEVVAQYPHLTKALHPGGVRLPTAVLEVMPAQHYLMGGVMIDSSIATTLPGLYAVGEVSSGVHGANRLAGGGGLEVTAAGAIAGESAAEWARTADRRAPRSAVAKAKPQPDHAVPYDDPDLQLIHSALDNGCGILRRREDLDLTIETLASVWERNGSRRDRRPVARAALVALAIARSARTREESRGDHFRIDHPARDDLRWLGNLLVSRRDTSLTQASELDCWFRPAGLRHEPVSDPQVSTLRESAVLVSQTRIP
jgi:aspartate oxidase